MLQLLVVGACFVGYIFLRPLSVPIVERMRLPLYGLHTSALVAYIGGTSVGHGPVRTIFFSFILFPVQAHEMLAMALSALFS